MSISGSRIVPPISLREVYTLMGVTPTNGIHDIGYICGNAHGQINKWSRNKPVRVNQPGEITDAQKQGVNFGLTMPMGYAQDYMGAINNATYAYNAPRPGTDWCRLTDFVNYSHIAKSPALDCEDVTLDKTYIGNDYTFNLNLNHYGHDDYNIGMDEIPGLSSMYLACILKSGDRILWKTAEKTLGEMGTSVTFENVISSWTRGSYYMCAASRIQSGISGTISDVDFYGLPFNTAGGASAEFTVTQTNPLLATLLGATDNPTGSRYIAVGDAIPGGLAYTCNANTGLWMQCEITNRATKSYTMSLTDLEGELRPSWDINASNDYTNSTTGYIQMQVYRLSGSTWTKVSESGTITFSPSSKMTLRIGHPQWSRYIDGALGSAVKSSAYVDYCEVRIIDRKSGMQIVNPGCRIHFI